MLDVWFREYQDDWVCFGCVCPAVNWPKAALLFWRMDVRSE